MDDIYHPKNGCELKSVVLGREASRKKSSAAPSRSAPSRQQLESLIAQWTECLGFLPHGERIGYQECIEELQELLDGNTAPIELMQNNPAQPPEGSA